MTRPIPAELLAFLDPFPASVRDIAIGLRERVLAVAPNAHETVWDAANAVSLAFSSAGRKGVDVCHVAAYAKHVNLGFADGASMADPLQLLKGTGTRIRHVTFREASETRAAWIDGYLRDALAVAGLGEGMGDGGTTVRVMNGPKRRPTAP